MVCTVCSLHGLQSARSAWSAVCMVCSLHGLHSLQSAWSAQSAVCMVCLLYRPDVNNKQTKEWARWPLYWQNFNTQYMYMYEPWSDTGKTFISAYFALLQYCTWKYISEKYFLWCHHFRTLWLGMLIKIYSISDLIILCLCHTTSLRQAICRLQAVLPFSSCDCVVNASPPFSAQLTLPFSVQDHRSEMGDWSQSTVGYLQWNGPVQAPRKIAFKPWKAPWKLMEFINCQKYEVCCTCM